MEATKDNRDTVTQDKGCGSALSRGNFMRTAGTATAVVAVILASSLGAGSALAAEAEAAAIDWSAVPAKTVKLFYPGQSTYQWLRTRDHKRADKKVRQGEACITCHEGDAEDVGKLIVAGERLEPAKLDGKQGVIDLKVQAAQDGTSLFWRFQWKTRRDYPGDSYRQLRFDAKEWKRYGADRLHEDAQSGMQPALYEDRLTIMLDDGSVPMFAEQVCWLTCHDGMRDTPDVGSADAVTAHPLLGKVLKKKDVRKYLPSTRTDEGVSWDHTKSAEEIAKLKAEGQFVDLMQWRAARSNVVGMADDGYVLEYRLFDQGKRPWSSNVAANKQPKFMYDAPKVGVKAVTRETMRDPKMPHVLVKGENAVAFDPNAGWKEGDMVPEVVLSRDVSGSAADNRNIKGEWKDGMWTVVWARRLDTGHPEDDKILKVGGVYTVGLAVHDDNITTRGHHVSFPLTLGIGTKADIEAVALK